jgi:aspartyl-tRNA(Asn)/glutamyl-tRNA(Gln) amidotransferase subunit A
LTCAGIGETRELLSRRGSSVIDHVQSALTTIRSVDTGLGAFVSITDDDQALSEAEAADDLVRELGPAAWHDRPLLGITISVKDLIQTRDLPTTRGSLLENRRARFDAPSVARLRAAARRIEADLGPLPTPPITP